MRKAEKPAAEVSRSAPVAVQWTPRGEERHPRSTTSVVCDEPVGRRSMTRRCSRQEPPGGVRRPGALRAPPASTLAASWHASRSQRACTRTDQVPGPSTASPRRPGYSSRRPAASSSARQPRNRVAESSQRLKEEASRPWPPAEPTPRATTRLRAAQEAPDRLLMDRSAQRRFPAFSFSRRGFARSCRDRARSASLSFTGTPPDTCVACAP